jgi:hypothetical protein
MANERVSVPPDAFIRKTGQVWKLVVGTIVLPFSIVAVALVQMRRLDQPTSELLPWLAVVVVGLVLIVLLLASISCPGCKRRLFWRVFTDPDSNAAIATFLARRDCPNCGYTP